MSAWRNAISTLLNYNADHQLLTAGQSYVVGVSGGPDSVCLLAVLHELAAQQSWKLHVAHVNYRRRGAESDADEALVRALAERWDLSCHVVQAQEPPAGNFQAWARELRYRFFRETCAELGTSNLVLAHQREDQVETFFLRLLRGSGPIGLAAMSPKSSYQDLTVLRPLLGLSRGEIMGALQDHDVPYRLDASNEETNYRRNQLRHELLPVLEAIQPGFGRALTDSLLILQGENALLGDWAQRVFAELGTLDQGRATLQRAKMQDLPRPLRLRVLRCAIESLTGPGRSITFHHMMTLEHLLMNSSGRAHYDLPGELSYEQDRQEVSFYHKYKVQT